jgi:cell division protein FtsA
MTEFAEEILGMPVRIGMPVGIKGITQLVHGPEYSTGVGLVTYGAEAMAEAALQPQYIIAPPPRSQQSSRVSISDVAPAPSARQKAGFWDWLKAAF